MHKHPLLIALTSIVLSLLAQIAMKQGTSRASASLAAAGADVAPSVLRLIAASLLQPWVLIGFALYGIGAVLWLYVLARWDVSKAYPLVGLGFVLTLLVGATFLGERVGWERTLGCALIVAGTALVARS